MNVKFRTGGRGHKNPRQKYTLIYLVLAGFCLFLFRPAIAPILESAAVLSVAVSMPEGTLQLIRDRFSADLEQPEQEPSPSTSLPSEPSQPPESESQSESVPESSQPPVEGQEIDPQFRGTVLDEQFSGKEDAGFIRFNSAWLRNYTKLSDSQVTTHLKKPLELKIPKGDKPTVLIIHTHATESFEEYDSPFYDIRNSWRTTDNTKNMVRVGEELATQLRNAGINVVHDTTQHDYPSYNGAYERSAKTIKEYLKKYPTIKVIFDMHRDAIERKDNIVVAPTAMIEGKKCAQIMVIAGCDNGLMNMPSWSRNLRFAAAITSKLESDYPGITRPILFDYRKYNMDLSGGLLLIEFGAGGNALDEVIYSAQLAGGSIAGLLLQLQV